MDNQSLEWFIFENIHGKRMDRVLWVGIPCVQNGRKGNMISIMPANPKRDLGTGSGQPIWIEEYEVQLILKK